MRDVRTAIAAAGLEVVDILSFYLQPEMDLDSMMGPLEFGAEIGATYALVIGDDPDWPRMCDNFGRFCDAAARLGLTRQWLHARSLSFAHPGSGDEVTFVSPYPEDLALSLEALRASG